MLNHHDSLSPDPIRLSEPITFLDLQSQMERCRKYLFFSVAMHSTLDSEVSSRLLQALEKIIIINIQEISFCQRTVFHVQFSYLVSSLDQKKILDSDHQPTGLLFEPHDFANQLDQKLVSNEFYWIPDQKEVMFLRPNIDGDKVAFNFFVYGTLLHLPKFENPTPMKRVSRPSQNPIVTVEKFY